jgi:DNA-binding response OmpR family regulator
MQKALLIADDDRELVAAIAFRCRRRGLKVLLAYDAFTALSLAKAEAPDMACLDVEMPAGNGLSVCEMLASDEACRSIPVAIMTARKDPETIIRCHDLCAYYVEKCPDVWSRLEPLLAEILGPPVASDPATSEPQFHACG